jgi:hypothetical protein
MFRSSVLLREDIFFSGYTAINFICYLENDFGDGIAVRGVFVASSFVRLGKAQCNNPRNEDDLKERIQDLVHSVSPAEFRCAMNNVFIRCDELLRTERKHLKHFL